MADAHRRLSMYDSSIHAPSGFIPTARCLQVKRKNAAFANLASWRLAEYFRKVIRMKIPSNVISQAQAQAAKLLKAPIQMDYKDKDTEMAPMAMVALHGLRAGCVTAAIELAAPAKESQSATNTDGMELAEKAEDEYQAMSSTSTKAYLATLCGGDSLTTKGACSRLRCAFCSRSGPRACYHIALLNGVSLPSFPPL